MTITIPFWIIPVAGFICGAIGAMTFDLLNRKKKCNHTALINKETPTWVNRAEQRKKDQAAGKKIAIMEIRAEIERRREYGKFQYDHIPVGLAPAHYFKGVVDTLDEALALLDNLLEQPEPNPANMVQR